MDPNEILFKYGNIAYSRSNLNSCFLTRKWVSEKRRCLQCRDFIPKKKRIIRVLFRYPNNVKKRNFSFHKKKSIIYSIKIQCRIQNTMPRAFVRCCCNKINHISLRKVFIFICQWTCSIRFDIRLFIKYVQCQEM